MTTWKAKKTNITEGVRYIAGSRITRPDGWKPPMKGNDLETAQWEEVVKPGKAPTEKKVSPRPEGIQKKSSEGDKK